MGGLAEERKKFGGHDFGWLKAQEMERLAEKTGFKCPVFENVRPVRFVHQALYALARVKESWWWTLVAPLAFLRRRVGKQ